MDPFSSMNGLNDYREYANQYLFMEALFLQSLPTRGYCLFYMNDSYESHYLFKETLGLEF